MTEAYPDSISRRGKTGKVNIIVADDHPLAASVVPAQGDLISVGLYSLQTMKRLQVLDSSGAAVADHVTIELP